MTNDKKITTHDELVSLCQDGKITMDEFIWLQDELRDEYSLFLQNENLKRGTESANKFLSRYEDKILMNQESL